MEYVISKQTYSSFILQYLRTFFYWCTTILNRTQYRLVNRLNPGLVLVKDSADQDFIELQTERMLGEHGNSILRLAYSYVRNMADAEDVLQDTLMQYMRTVPDFQDPAHEKAWLLRVAINCSKNKIKYNNKREAFELDDNLISEHKNDLAFVWDAVNHLPLTHRAVIHLYYHEGYSTAQIAQIMNKKEPTIRSLMHRAREKLKSILEEEYDFTN